MFLSLLKVESIPAYSLNITILLYYYTTFNIRRIDQFLCTFETFYEVWVGQGSFSDKIYPSIKQQLQFLSQHKIEVGILFNRNSRNEIYEKINIALIIE